MATKLQKNPGAVPAEALAARLHRWKRSVQVLVLSNVITSVATVLTVLWFVISWFVYLAEREAEGSNIRSYGDSLWWGIVTLLTIGYGDRYPVTRDGRFLAGLLMLSGVVAVAILTSKISSAFLERILREGRGIVNTAKLKDHFVICGWKEEMHEILLHILDFNPDLRSDDLVLIANISQADIETLKEHPRLKGIQVIVGDYVQTVTLQRAAPERARKVLILADKTPHAGGSLPSITETDARTIMCAMSLANIARGTLVAAELMDPKMDQYLKLAQVNEIIYSREYSRLLLGNVSGGTGIANIIFDLLDPKTSTWITSCPIPESMVGSTYGDFKQRFEELQPDSLVIGVLENTGNSHRIKEMALRQAQKTPDMHRLVENLRSVKHLQCNHPVFNPASAYVIPAGSMAIVLQTHRDAGGKTPKPEEAEYAV